jgi:hypothetical protein
MVDPVTMIVTALVTGMLAGLQATAEQAVKDGYQALKDTIIRKYGRQAKTSIEQLEREPLSQPRQEVVAQELRKVGAGQDTELQRLANDLTYIIENLTSRPGQLVPVVIDPIEQAQRQAGVRVVGQVMDRHITGVLSIRSSYMLDDTDLLTSNITRKNNVPQAVRDEIAGLHNKIRGIIEQISSRIEEGKYKDAEQAIANLPLAYAERQRASNLVHADKRMHISYQTLKVTVEFFSELNQIVLRKIERENSPQKESNMMLGNAIMIYELTDFVIRYIEGFTVNGAADIEKLHNETKQKIADLRNQQKALEQRAMAQGVEPIVRDQTLEDIRNREAAMDELDREWNKYASEVKQLYSTVGEVRGRVPTLEVIRENAQVQITLIQLVAMLRFLKQNSDAIKGTVDALKGFRLAPLSPNRVRRLLGI